MFSHIFLTLFVYIISIVLLPAMINVAIKKHGTNERTNMLQIEPLKTFTKSFVLLIFWSV